MHILELTYQDLKWEKINDKTPSFLKFNINGKNIVVNFDKTNNEPLSIEVNNSALRMKFNKDSLIQYLLKNIVMPPETEKEVKAKKILKKSLSNALKTAQIKYANKGLRELILK
jgi:hypothetical protein